MKKYMNESGSFPLVLLIVFMLLISIASLTSLLLSEKVNIRFSIDKDVQRVYEKESMVELTKNLTNQLLLSKEWEVIEGEEVLSSRDLSLIEEMVNEEALPLMNIEGSVYIKDIPAPITLEDYCQELDDGEAVVLTYECLDEKFQVELEITIERAEEFDTFTLVLEDWAFMVSDTEEKVLLQKL